MDKTFFKRAGVSVLAIVSICLVITVGLLLRGNIHFLHTAYNITETATGFSPSQLVVTEGDTVTFTSQSGEPFWPASNAHPSHTDYSAFDPKKPIAADDSWSFTFTEAGTYGFHDHLNPTFKGELIVQKKDGTRVTVDCSTQKNQQCWEKMVLDTLTNQGIKPAFDELVHLSETEPDFSNDCHSLSHLIGERAYVLYTSHQNFELTPATALCGYGFYHGFMETMLYTTGNIDEARSFCEFVDQQLKGQASAAATACYHGTGHGAIDGGDPTTWGDIDAMLAPGFKICSLLAKTDLQTYLCETGVFNAIEILSKDPKYKLTEFRKDPFVMCNAQPVVRREGCYANMIPILFDNYGNDFRAIFDYVNKNMRDHDAPAIDGNTVNDLTTIGIMFEYIRVHGQEPDHMQKGIAFCRSLPSDDHLPCIEGLSGGYIKYGEPGKEYVKNLEFCALSELTEDERDSCYKYTLPRMNNRYSQEETNQICSLVPVQYKDRYCPQF